MIVTPCNALHRPLTGRERAYINAVRALFANGTSLQARETTYSTLMQVRVCPCGCLCVPVC